MAKSKKSISPSSKVLSSKQSDELLTVLQDRFDKNMSRHVKLKWSEVRARLMKHPEKLWSLREMEDSGGEPDVVGQDAKTGEYLFIDCAAETPKDQRSVCYDREGLESRKAHKPADTAMDMAAAIRGSRSAR